ncbi:response regulator [Bacteriovorax sp. Seq25_V]|uniref:response regulator n=1 Tax=Bacteriovorax sp. Seq25_V TaxID=1201288 RepID=UPI00042457DE|nr:response regulator [Bacteriovorax sp. Seq25_V]
MSITLPKIKDSEKPAVLIIDDEVKICMLIKTFLEQTKLFRNVVVAENASIGMLKLRNDEFDLVIVDFQLPDKEGTYLVEMAKKSLKFRKLKFLLISGYLDNRSMINVINSGIKHVLVKPFSRDDLISKVLQILKLD